MKKIITAILAGALLFNATNAAAYDWEETLLCGKAVLKFGEPMPSYFPLEDVNPDVFSMKRCTEHLMSNLYVGSSLYAERKDNAIYLYWDEGHKSQFMTLSHGLSWTRDIKDGKVFALLKFNRMKDQYQLQSLIECDSNTILWQTKEAKTVERALGEYDAYINTGKGE